LIAGKLLARQRVLSVIANEEPVECRVSAARMSGAPKKHSLLTAKNSSGASLA